MSERKSYTPRHTILRGCGERRGCKLLKLHDLFARRPASSYRTVRMISVSLCLLFVTSFSL